MKTVLCVPGHDEKKVQNCRKYGADLILFDLEDSVPEGMKDRAREIVAGHVTANDAVRINADGDERLTDLRVLSRLDFYPHSLWIPKSDQWSMSNPLRPGRSDVVDVVFGSKYRPNCVFIAETPRALLTLAQKAGSDYPLEQLTGIAFGAADFAAYMNVPPNSPQVQYARQQVALAAKALGVEAYDSPCTTMNVSQVCAETRSACGLGYGWKGVVHPEQIVHVKHADDAHRNWDRKLVDLYDAQSEAVIMWDGDIIAPPMIRAARKRLEDDK